MAEAQSLSLEATALLADCCGRLLDRDSGHVSMLRDVLGRFTPSAKGTLSVNDMARLCNAEAALAYHMGHVDQAIGSLQMAIALADLGKLTDVQVMARYILARCYSKRGQYRETLSVIRAAKSLCTPNVIHGQILTTIEVFEARVLFSLDDITSAEAILVRIPYKRSGDCVEYCNILSLHARILRRRGHLRQAIECLRKTIDICEQKAPAPPDVLHRILAHCYASLAFTHLLEVREQPKLSCREIDSRMELVQSKLQDAERLCREGRYDRITGRVYYYRALYSIDEGQLPDAQELAKRAYAIAQSIEDSALMAHALITQSSITREAPVALGFARRALDIANRSENRRVQARANICLARVYLQGPIANRLEASRLYDTAKSLLNSSDMDYVTEELVDLENNLKTSPEAQETVLVSVSNFCTLGLERSLREVEDTVISRVLEQFNRNVAQTAKVLRTSRRRVRLVLGRRNKLAESALKRESIGGDEWAPNKVSHHGH
jgi:tetratricopeptide (TPR) repeat protein